MTSTPSARTTQRDASRATVLAVLGGYALCVLLLALFLHQRPIARPTTQSATGTTQPTFPSPPAGAVVFSREAGSNLLALAVVPRAGQVLVQASVVGPDGTGVSGATTSFRVEGSQATGSTCGTGCYRATIATRGRPRAVEVVTEGPVSARWRVALPSSWPPAEATNMLADARRVWRALRSLTFTERLASDEDHVVKSTWRVQAPDRLAYQVEGGSAAVIIGKRRWDRAPGGRWRRSPQLPITQPTPPWVSVANARVLDATTLRGRRAWRVSFFDPKLPGWFTLVLDRHTLRTLDLRMVTTAHFMHEIYGSFDAAPEIQAPRQN
jgi:hypothetical protein